MKLPIPSFFSKKEKPEFLLSLLLRDEKAGAVILEQLGGKLRIISKHEEYFATSLENATEEEWLDILDKTISRAEEMLPSNIETHKTVFGVKETWVEDKRIKKEYLLKLKKVCESLALTPIGFLVITEAITHYLQIEEGAPISAIIAEVGIKSVSASLVKAGRVIETHHAEIETSEAETVDTMLKTFTTSEVLPARIIIFDGDKGEDHAQQFIAHQWSKSLPFLHVPQITILPSGFDAKAVVFGAAAQMGLEVMSSPLIGREENMKTFLSQSRSTDPNLSGKAEENPEALVKEPLPKETNEKILATVPGENFGFVLNQDITQLPIDEKIPEELPHNDKSVGENAEIQKGEEQKFIINDPHEKSSAVHNDNFTEVNPLKDFHQKEEKEQEPEIANTIANQHVSKKSPLAFLSSIAGVLAIMRIPSVSIPKGNKFIIIIPTIIIILIALVALYIYSLKATVTLSIKPKSVDQNANVIFTNGTNNDFGNNIVQANEESLSLDGSLSTAATGKKEVGDKAKGTVTLFNSDDTKKQLSAGTTITSSNGLEFTIDKDIAIASSSGDIFTGIKSGTTQASVTAKAIGQEYNLPSGTKFSVAGTTAVAAKNDSAFSGGSKKNIIVVAKGDIDKLKNDLPKSLEKKAQDEIATKITSDNSFLPTFTNVTLSKIETDKNVNDETKTVTLKATVVFTGLAYQNTSLMDYAKSLVKDKSSSDEQIPVNGIKNALKNITKKSDKEITAQLMINTTLLPKIDEAMLKKEIAGKSFEDAKTTLSKLPHVTDVTITLQPSLPFLPKLLPRIGDNITLSVEQLHE